MKSIGRRGQHTATLVWKVMDMIPDLRGKSVLDVGCGQGMWGFFLKTEKRASHMHGLDIFQPYVNFCKKLGIYDSVQRLDLENESIPSEKYDLIICSEVLEHLKKNSALKLLEEMKLRLKNRGMIIVTTPTYFFEEGGMEKFSDNRFQRHKSSWSAGDFRKNGYNVIGYGFTYNNRLFWIHSKVSEMIPRLGGSFIAWYKKSQ